jgi:hypothetical protein
MLEPEERCSKLLIVGSYRAVAGDAHKHSAIIEISARLDSDYASAAAVWPRLWPCFVRSVACKQTMDRLETRGRCDDVDVLAGAKQ